MMSKIEFRGKRVDNGKWVYGYYVLHDDNEHLIYTGKEKLVFGSGTCWDIGEKFEVIPESVGQYTGLKDKNGENVFEVDIVKNAYDTFTVLYLQGEFIIRRTRDNYDESLSSSFYDIEVIGNIHDNPDLLGVK